MDKYETPPPYYQPPQGPQDGHQHQMQNVGQPTPTSPPPTVSVHVTATDPTWTGTCPVCHTGTFKSGFTLCGWLCCLFCFPCGIICCFCMRKKKCSHCGFSPA